jgi:hypothetical protein
MMLRLALLLATLFVALAAGQNMPNRPPGTLLVSLLSRFVSAAAAAAHTIFSSLRQKRMLTRLACSLCIDDRVVKIRVR